MTPTVTDLLHGCIATLMTPPRPEDAGLYAGARIRITALVNMLVALECANGIAVRVWENAALRVLIAEAGPQHGAPTARPAEAGLPRSTRYVRRGKRRRVASGRAP